MHSLQEATTTVRIFRPGRFRQGKQWIWWSPPAEIRNAWCVRVTTGP